MVRGLDQTDFELDGQEGALVNVTLVHPSGPEPGMYLINLLGYDEDNDVSSPHILMLDVPVLSDTRIEFDYTTIPVNPSNVTSVDIRLFNLGNSNIGYDLFLESPPAGMQVSMIFRPKEVQTQHQPIDVRGWSDDHWNLVHLLKS